MKFVHPQTGDSIGLHFDYEQRNGEDVSTTLTLWNITKKELLDGVGYPLTVRKFVGDIGNREYARQMLVRRMLDAFRGDGRSEMAKLVGRAYFERSKKTSKKKMPPCVVKKEWRGEGPYEMAENILAVRLADMYRADLEGLSAKDLTFDDDILTATP